MNEVKIKYKLPLLPVYRTMNTYVPEKFDELNQEQYLLMFKLRQENISEERLTSIILGVPRRIVRKLGDIYAFRIQQLYKDTFEHEQTSRFMIKVLRVGKKNYIGPEDRLANLTFGQLVFALSYYEMWGQSHQVDTINKLVASLFLLPGEKFSERFIQERKDLFNQVDLLVKEAVVYNLHLLLLYLADCYIWLFGKNEKKKNSAGSWLDVLDGIVGDDLVNQQKYADMPAHEALRYLNNKIKWKYKHG